MSFVMQVLTEIPQEDDPHVVEVLWTNINRGNQQFQRTWKKINAGRPVRVLHPFNKKKGGRPFKVVKNAEALPKGFEASGVDKS